MHQATLGKKTALSSEMKGQEAGKRKGEREAEQGESKAVS